MQLLSIEKAAQQCGVDLSKLDPLTVEFTQALATQLAAIPKAEREVALRKVIEAMRDYGPDTPQRVINALFTKGGAA